ncbi:MAG: TM1266 family iron-only hydrogenase system putative regulator [candidate division WOR-3 bacterium]
MGNLEQGLQRVGLIGIFVDDKDCFLKVQELITEYSQYILGRAGFNLPEVTVIVLIFKGTTDDIGSFTGKMGKINGVQVRTLLKKTI